MSDNAKEAEQKYVASGGGPLGYGYPEDKRLRRVEENVILPNRLKEEAEKRCVNPMHKFLKCAQDWGLLVVVKCRNEYRLKDECLLKWMKDENFIKEVTEKYLEERTYFRSTGKSKNMQFRVRGKKTIPEPIEEN